MHGIDYIIVLLYLVVLLYLGFRHRLKSDSSVSEMIVGGRMLTLPAFIASLVSTWYGGILGVGEYSFRYGLSNWIVFGVPYYIAALLFALFLAKKARESRVLTIPERLSQRYGEKTALVGSIIIYLITVPSAYILMLGILSEKIFGIPFWIGIIAGALVSIVYVYTGAFNSVVRTDLFQFVLMFAGFIVLFVFLVNEYGGLSYLKETLPKDHLTLHGGNSLFYIFSWYIIALTTMVEPVFHQRCYAAKNIKTARNGIFVSILFWVIFDFFTTTCGLYARAVIPQLSDPLNTYPALAMKVLPAGVLGLFVLALFSTVMSTVDSYSFLAASTFGNDIVPRLLGKRKLSIIRVTQIGLLISSLMAVLFAIFFRSVIEIWYAFGSIGTPALLLPVFTAFVSKKKLSSSYALTSITCSGLLSLVWYLSKFITSDNSYFLGIEPIFPGLILSILILIVFSIKEK